MTNINKLYEKKILCPICNEEFITQKVRFSKLRLIRRDKDFFSYYEGLNPLKYSIFVCPNCGFSATENKYVNISEEEKKIILKEISSKWNKRAYGGIRSIDDGIGSHKLALYIGNLLDYNKIDLGSLCLSIAWLYRLKQDEEEYRFLELAVNLYEEGYYTESLVGTNMDELRLGYLIGELNRRLGNREKAIKWFNTVISNPELKFNSMLENMVREQWRLTREED